MSKLPEITVSFNDFDRLSSLLSHTHPDNSVAGQLLEELDRANIVPHERLQKNTVCMNSKIRFRNDTDDTVYEKFLVYPHEVIGSTDNISILTPAGTALLGLRVGDSIEWALTDSRKMKIVLLDVIQPTGLAALNNRQQALS